MAYITELMIYLLRKNIEIRRKKRKKESFETEDYFNGYEDALIDFTDLYGASVRTLGKHIERDFKKEQKETLKKLRGDYNRSKRPI